MPLLVLLLLGGVATTNLQRAKKEVSELKFRQAAATLELVSKAEGLSADEVRLFFELKARAAASLGKEDEARASFEQLLELSPGFTLQGRASPKLTGPLFEARATVERQGALLLTLTPNESQGLVESVTISLKGPLQRVKQLRVVVTAGGTPGEVVVTPDRLATPVPIKATSATVSVVVEGLRGWQLATMSQRFEATPVVSTPPPPPRLTPIAAPTNEVQVAPARTHAVRTAGQVTLGVGAAVLATGIGFFAFGKSASTRFDEAVGAQMNGVLPLTISQARQLDADVTIGRTGSTVAWIGAGVLVVTGVVLWLLDGSGS
jgi:hypothetical protein